ncbi:hypothetical protein ABFV67_16635 [Vibrio metschnikovii]|uniref:hypothetical protein n=1 Tax=Vibrio metschnikovii TaxID=28172 RepID=UPI002A14FBC3|nr:hypothetical protein [Vibrio metschnikovii]EKO3612364.1 hypothetical protein [Vibrio metschnikovii]EKO3685053.1 hypothetical protein [Vibrio metschnikovii]EKO3715714.1 hypothetical protein [Vibrio metschnikovii]EKO3740418.1 hypothetical protein [Vibrio metschnikovii]
MLGNIGLVLDIIGFTLMLFFNPRMGMLEEHIDVAVKTGKSVVTIPDYSAKDIRKIKRSMRLHKFGIVLIIIGFILQLVHSIYPDLAKTLCLGLFT